MTEKKTLKTFRKEYSEMSESERRIIKRQCLFWLVLILGPVIIGFAMYLGLLTPID